MTRKARQVIRDHGIRQLVVRARWKLENPHLRYDEPERPLHADEDLHGYHHWIETEEARRFSALPDPKVLRYRPLVSVLMPVYNVEARILESAVESVRAQVYNCWELLIVDDMSTRSDTKNLLQTIETMRDDRIRVFHRQDNGGISSATNTALAHAEGEFIALMDDDDLLSPMALLCIIQYLNEHPDLDIVYSDEDKIDNRGIRHSPFFKPDWSPVLLLSMNYVSHLGVYRTSLAREVGGFNPEFDGAQDYDFLWRCAERSNRIGHVPEILYHWRVSQHSTAASMNAKPYVIEQGRLVVQAHLDRQSIQAEAKSSHIPARYRISRNLSEYPAVSVIIPTRDHVELLADCVHGVETCEYPGPIQIVIVDNGSSQRDAVEYLHTTPHQVLRRPGPFNYSFLVNQGEAVATGELLLILNNDIRMIEPSWLRTLADYLLLPDIGVVGPKLLYPDGRVQHAGIIYGLGGTAGHAFWMEAGNTAGYLGLLQVSHDVSAVTGACLLTRHEVFQMVKGFPENLPINYNDLAFCLAVQQAGWRIAYVAEATLIHYESVSRRPQVQDWELQEFRRQHVVPSVDPYYSPHLSTRPGHVYSFPWASEENSTVRT